MPEAIISASGVNYGAGVNEYNRLLVDAVISGTPTFTANIIGSIMIGSVSAQVDSIYIQSGAQVEVYGSGTFIGSIVSMPAINVAIGSETWIKAGSVEVYNRVAGSIVDMPNVVGVSGTYFQNILGSVQVNTGSVRAQVVQVTSPWVVSGTATVEGSVYATGSITISNFVNPGSTYVTNIVGVSGTLFQNILGSVQISAGSVRAMDIQVTSPWVVSGTATIEGSAFVTGSVNIATTVLGVSGTYFQNMLGSVQVNAGSVAITTNVLGVSGTYFQNILGSVQVNAGSVAITNTLLPISGNVLVSGLVGIRNPETIGSWTGYVGSIWSMPAVNVSVGSNVYIKGGSLEGTSQFAGSIWSMPAVSVAVGSEVYIKGGSLEGVSQIAGSIWSMPDVAVAIGSESWIKGGSVEIYGTKELGSVVIKSSNLLGISGPVWIQNPVGISGVNDIGSVVIKSAPVLGVSGLIFTDGNLVGSMVIKAPRLEVSGNILGSIFFGGGVGSVMLSGTLPLWLGVGSVVLSGTSIPTWRGIGSSLILSVNSAGTVQSPLIADGSYFMIAGSISSMPSVSVSAGSRSYLLASGAAFHELIGTVEDALIVSLSGGVSLAGIGSYTGMSNGSIFWGGGVGSVMLSGTLPLWLGVGSVVISGAPGAWTGVGSVTGNVGVSGAVLRDLLGSFYFAGGVGSVQISGTSLPVWKGIGSVLTEGVGSVVISGTSIPVFRGIGSVLIGAGVGSVVISGTSIPPWRGIGSVLFANVGIGSVVISGCPQFWTGVGSVHIGTGIGSVYICGRNDDITENIGSPCFKTSILIASGGYSDTWKIGGAGSRLAIHGWHISTNLPGTVRILVSGTTNTAAVSPGLISEYFLYYASGATIEKSFLYPMIPAGGGSAIGFGTTCAGSTTFTIFGREVK